jgi:hypothetical protein
MQETGKFPVENSSYFNFLIAERLEIQKVRWIESERLKADCGQDRAVWVWVCQYRDAWRRGLRASGIY